MCGRFASDLPPDLVARVFGTRNALPNLAPNWNTAPSQQAVVVRRHPETGERHLDALKWGLLPSWTEDPTRAQKPINARSETVARMPIFRGAYAKRRAIVPITAFYEWRRHNGAKQPFAIGRADDAPFALAGLWEGYRWKSGEVVRTFCVLTTAAGPVMRPVHDRMPVILEPDDWPLWLGETDGDPSTVIRPGADDGLRLWPVSSAVNSTRNNGPEPLRRIDDDAPSSSDAAPGENPA